MEGGDGRGRTMRETATSSHESGAGLKGLITIPESEFESIFLSVSPAVVAGAAIVGLWRGRRGVGECY